MKYFGLSGALALSAVLLSGCCGGNRACSVPEELLVARDSVCTEDSSADVSIVFDAPLDKSLPLSAAVGEYFSEVLGGSYQDDSRDFKAAAQYYFDAIWSRRGSFSVSTLRRAEWKAVPVAMTR